MHDNPKEIRIRRALQTDAASISALLRDSFTEYKALYTDEGFAATTPPPDALVRRLEEGPVWIVLDEEEIVGTVSVVPKGESLYIRGMAIAPGARGRGIGVALLRQVEEYARANSFRRLFLSTTPFLARAIRLYENYGFHRTSAGPDSLFGTPLFSMEKQLGPSTPKANDQEGSRLR